MDIPLETPVAFIPKESGMISYEHVLELIKKSGAPCRGKQLQLYVHIPFCTSKCHFCDYVLGNNTKQLTSRGDKQVLYVAALCQQIRKIGPELMDLGYIPTSIYWGGGTPSRLSPEHLHQIGIALQESFDLSAIESHSMEASPETLSAEHISALSFIDLNRISIGVQTFQPDVLRKAGRAHSVDQAVEAIQIAQSMSIEDVNIDLISGFPGETIEQISESAKVAVDLDVSHVSIYPYRPSPGSRMLRHIESGRQPEVDGNYVKRSYSAVRNTLTELNFEEYCLSYFSADPKFRSKVSLHIYDQEGDIIGFGSGGQSVLGWHRLINENSGFDRFLNNPLSFETCTRFGSNEEQVESLLVRLGGALQTGHVNFDKWHSATGVDLEQLLMNNSKFQNFISHLKYCGGIISKTQTGINLSKSNLSDVYINHIYSLVKRGALDRGLRA